MKKGILKYGIRDGIEFHISEVESGLKCQCNCPCCGEKLIAKKGRNAKPQNHFAHKSNIQCEYAYETSLHYEAKRIIEKRKEISLPFRKPIFETHNLNGFYFKTHNKKRFGVIESRKYKVGNIILEKKLHNIVPDIKCEVSGKTLLIEIAVTHKVQEEKQKKIIEIGLPVIEIDLSGLNRIVNENELERNVLENIQNKSWFGNVKDEELIDTLIRKHRQIINEINYLVENKPIKGTRNNPVIKECPFTINNYETRSIRFHECEKCSFNLASYEFNILCGYRNYLKIKKIIEKYNEKPAPN